MYLEHFGLTRSPFQIAPDDSLLYLSKKHAKAFVYMDYAAWQPDGFVIVTGEIGAGKSTLIKRLLRKIKGKAVCFHLPFTNLSNNELLSFMAKQANIRISIDDKVSLIYALTDYFKEITSSGIPCVLIIDEAQNLSPSNLEDIRMLAGLEGPSGSMLRVIMLGQPEFVNTINESEQMKQRVKLHYHLTGLDLTEVKLYINFRLELCGLPNHELFNETLIEAIFKLSNGIPRLINKICDALLICAFSDNKIKPDIEDIESIAQDLMMIPHDGEQQASKIRTSSPSSEGLNNTSLDRIATALEALCEHLGGAEPVGKKKGPKKSTKEGGFLGLRSAK